MTYITLFAVSFLAATLLPLGGEAYLESKGHLSVKKLEKYRSFFAKYGG